MFFKIFYNVDIVLFVLLSGKALHT